jgi:hypothetical protein
MCAHEVPFFEIDPDSVYPTWLGANNACHIRGQTHSPKVQERKHPIRTSWPLH